MRKTADKCEDVIRAFVERRPLRTRKLNLTKEQCSCYWTRYKQDLSGYRDEVKVRNGTAIYYLWGKLLAKWDGRYLTIDYNDKFTMLTLWRAKAIFWGIQKAAGGRSRKDHFLNRFCFTKQTVTYDWIHYFPSEAVFPFVIDMKESKIVSFSHEKGIRHGVVSHLLLAKNGHSILSLAYLIKNLGFCFSKDEQVCFTKRLLRSNNKYNLPALFEAAGELKIFLPEKVKNHVAARLFQFKLDESLKLAA